MANNDAAFQAEETCLANLASQNDKQAYAIPLYQRRYVWNIAQNQQLWEDILNCYYTKTNHFLGSIVLMSYHPDEYSAKSQADVLIDHAYSVKHVVDGQQRLTSLSLALAALSWDMKSQEDRFWAFPDIDDEDKSDWDLLKVTIMSHLITDVKDVQSKTQKGKIPRLIPVKAVYEAYKSIANKESCGKYHLLEKAFVFYQDRIMELRESLYPQGTASVRARQFLDFYSQMCDAMTHWVKFVKIVCRDGEDPFQVFESLNGTGQSLTGADRIKNVLMGKGSHETPAIPISKVESRWANIEEQAGGSKEIEAFITCYLFTKTCRRVPRKDLCDVFNKQYLGTFTSISKAMDDLCRAADMYGTIMHQYPYNEESGKATELDKKTVLLLKNILKNNRQQSVVPLLAIATTYGFGAEFKHIAQCLLNLLVRFKVCQKSTNILDKVFEQFCEGLETKSPAELGDLLKLNMPADPAFKAEFANQTFDSGKAADTLRARYYLLEIENYICHQNGQGDLNVQEEYTLEHVIPQTFEQSDWFAGYPDMIASFDDEDGATYQNFRDYTINSIGNMCLLRRPENSAASNKNFTAKLASYEKPDQDGKTAVGTFQLVRQIKDNNTLVKVGAVEEGSEAIVADGSTFDSQSVRIRARAMAEIAAKIW